MKIPFLNKSFSSSFSSYSNPSSWAWPSCHQNPRTKSLRATIIAINPKDVEEEEDDEKTLNTIIFSSSSSSVSSTIYAIEELSETESIENVIK
ncbi:hypothetical protein V5N11_006021 [Cardamine amara subsp. amara]|uniref:Uncharacterized protein n=1 Tax=Cardamine amara subsp. amara TaxID=228776 RepID=A0ABD1BTA9_CARAN